MEKIINFILDEQNIEKIFLYLAILGPIIGILVGVILSLIRKKFKIYLSWGVVLGFFGTLFYIMWKLYSYITDKLGLDTVKNLVVNLIIFIFLGIIIGLLLRLLPRASEEEKS